MLDTGFDGAAVIPPHPISNGIPADLHMTWVLSDGSEVSAAAYRGTARIGNLPAIRPPISVLGNEPVAGRAVISRFGFYLDHGRSISIEP